MDPVTHALAGALIGAATAGKERRAMPRRAMWGALFGLFPDIDAVLALFTDQLTFLNLHRRETHSVLLLPAWAALLGMLAAWPAQAGSHERWRDWTVLAAAVLAAHIVGDLVTSYGTKIFAPVYNAPFAFPITFIIDPVVTLILLAGLVGTLWTRRTIPGGVAAVMLVAWFGLETGAQQRALEIGQQHAREIGVPDAPVVVFPQPLSPLRWKIVVVEGDNYRRAYVDLWRDKPQPRAPEDAGLFARVLSAYQPADALQWKTVPRLPADPEYRSVALAAWSAPVFAGFREFALLPHVTRMNGDMRHLCVAFSDLRFSLSGRSSPFEYTLCRAGAAAWQLQHE